MADLPFDPAAAGRVQEIIDAFNRNRWFELDQSEVDDLAEVLRQLADAEHRSLQLAEASARHRAEIDGLEEQLAGLRASLHTEWAAAHSRHGWTDDCMHDEMRTEDEARRMGNSDGWYVLRRLVGDWGRADGQPGAIDA